MHLRPTILATLTAAALCGQAFAGGQHGRGHDDHGHHGRRPQPVQAVQFGPRPFFLVNDMDEGPLKRRLQSCVNGPFRKSEFSIGHRGAPLQFPEHTKESYEAAARMGAGVLECDVTFTKDRELVCRHSQCDLHTTTNILEIPKLAAKCSIPFTPADPATGTPARVRCCTSDLTLEEFKRLQGKMDAFNPMATTPEEYMRGTANWRTDLYSARGTLLTHEESIRLFRKLGTKFTPELKAPSVPMPFQGTYTQEQYAQQMIDEYKATGIHPKQVYPQSFNLNDVLYWINNEPHFGRQAVFLDERVDQSGGYEAAIAGMHELSSKGVRIVAPPIWALIELDHNKRIVPSQYAIAARSAGLNIITWTLERSGLLRDAKGPPPTYYYQSVAEVINNDGDVYKVLDVLARDVGVLGVFSDWPATVTYYANCMNLN